MVPLDVRRTLGAMVTIVALALAAAPRATFAQLGSPAAEDGVPELVVVIEEIQSLRGENSPDLIEPLTTLSLVYEERRDYEVALSLIEQATHVIEVNHGLHTLDEAQLMRHSIRLERARGNAEAAWNEEKELLRLIRRRRHQADARTIAMLDEIADHRRAILARYRAGEFPAEIVLGCYYSEVGYDDAGNPYRSKSGNRQTVIRALLAEADRYDSEAAAVSGRLERWIELPCPRPEPSALSDRRSTRPSKDEMQAYFRAVSDYAGCTQAKYEHAARTSASPDELSQHESARNAAAAELSAQAKLYDERFGR
jgi:hypothetical protein